MKPYMKIYYKVYHNWSSRKCKYKLYCGITINMLEWLSKINKTVQLILYGTTHVNLCLQLSMYFLKAKTVLHTRIDCIVI